MGSRQFGKDESQSLEIVVEVLASGNYNNQATISNVNEEDSNEDNDEADAKYQSKPGSRFIPGKKQ